VVVYRDMEEIDIKSIYDSYVAFVIEALVKAATLDPDGGIRKIAIDLLNSKLSDDIMILRAYQDGQKLYLDLQLDGNSPKKMRICEIPEVYAGQKTIVYEYNPLEIFRNYMDSLDV